MNEPIINVDPGWPPVPCPAISPCTLLELLLSDAVNDVQVVSRELGLRGEMCERLRRALDRIACAQSVLETVCTGATDAEQGGAAAELLVREALELLAKEWPEDYPAGAVEWLIAGGV